MPLPLIPEENAGREKKNLSNVPEKIPDKAISGFTLSRGSSADSIALKWNSPPGENTFIIYRSIFQNGPFDEVGTAGENAFTDKSAAPGMKYWYRVLMSGDDLLDPLSDVDFGFRKSGPIMSENLDDVIRGKNRECPGINDGIKADLEKEHAGFLEKYYINQVKLSLVIYVGGGYIKNGDLKLIRDFDRYELNPEKREIYFMKGNACIVKFNSGKLYNFFNECRKVKKSNALIKRLMKNVMAYCIYTGDAERIQIGGAGMFIPSYEALGISTEYYRDCRNWRTSTVMIGSGSRKLKKMMEDAQKKRDNE